MEPSKSRQEPTGYEPTEDLAGGEIPIKKENESMQMEEEEEETPDEGYLYLSGAKEKIESASEGEATKRSRYGLVRPFSREGSGRSLAFRL